MPSGGSTTSNTVATPWTGQQPYLSSVFGGAQNTYNQYSGNPSSSVAGFTPDQQQAMGITQGVANGTNFGNASGVNNAAGSFNTDLLNGSYLNSNPANSTLAGMANNNTGSTTLGAFANGSMNNNPYETGALDAANDAITRAYQTATAPQTSSAMEASGRYGSGANANAVSQNQQNLATQLGNTDASLTNSMYQQNMGNQLSAAGALGQQQLGAAGTLGNNYSTGVQQMLGGLSTAPNTVNSINGAATNLYNMGGNQQAYNQSVINAPWQLLNNYSNLIQGQYGGNTSTTTPYYTNTLAGGMGGALGGAALAGSMGYNPAYGAAAGGLMGLL
jgi:hypothetical protein